MPKPGDLITAFKPQPDRCFRMVYSRQLQATHCRQPPLWTGIWRDRMGKSWYVEACRKHAPKATQQTPGGMHYASDHTRTSKSKRYGSAAVPASSLKQAWG